jgi:hypothetical protein
MPLQATSGAASYDAFGGGVPFEPTYIEQIFQTWLYTGNGSTQTITNGIDLAGKGGLVWIKSRSAATNNFLFDTNRGALLEINSNTTDAQASLANSLTAFNADGFSLGSAAGINVNAATYASWTFRKQPKFFDVVTYTGNGTTFQTVNHNLGSTPGCIIVKQTNSGSTNWVVIHRDLAGDTLRLNLTDAKTGLGGNALPSSTSIDFYGSGGSDPLNASGGTYVAYLFAHNAGGFGLTGTDNVISCGSYTGTGSTQSISLGYEPQWLMIKRTDAINNWQIVDVMRGWVNSSTITDDNPLYANLTNAEGSAVANGFPTATGFTLDTAAAPVNASGGTYIYIAIRRGPMKVPTTGTSVFGLNARTGTGANATVTGGAGVSDAVLIKNRGAAVGSLIVPRLTGTGYLLTSSTIAEQAAGSTVLQTNPWDVMDGIKVGTTSTGTNASANTYINYLFDRAPGFMDVCCYTGTGAGRTQAHNLGAAPEMMIVRSRSATGSWVVYHKDTGIDANLILQGTNAVSTGVGLVQWNSTLPTTTVFSVGNNSGSTNDSSVTYVAYLFASCLGVSKVGGYTGTGTTQTINCGFTAGSRFVLIKATSTTGDWYVWDSARGIVAGNDPYLALNSTAAEVTNTDWVDTAATGFELSNAGGNLANSNGVSYIFLAIA